MSGNIETPASLKKSIVLHGLDGSNPLGYLSALGTHRICSQWYREAQVTMRWSIIDGSWRPILESPDFETDAQSFCKRLSSRLADPPQFNLLEAIGDNLTLSPSDFASLATSQLNQANANQQDTKTALSFLAAFGTDALAQSHSKDRSQMQDTALRTMSGAGHQHFIKFMREIIANTDASQLHATLFQPWMYEDEGRGMNLRWDPIDDRRYAMRWKNPSSDASSSMRGANRLAIEAMPLFPTAPMANKLETTGFRVYKGAFWSWPIWDCRLELPVIQSLLNRPFLSRQNTATSSELKELGISAVFRSQRITVGKFRNFTPAKTV